MGTRYPAVQLSNKTRVWHNLRGVGGTFVVIKNSPCFKGGTTCRIAITKPKKVHVVDEETGTWCIDCSRERGHALARMGESPPHVGVVALHEVLLLRNCPAVLTRDESEWTNMYTDIIRAVTECFPERSERICAELARRAPIKENT